MTLRAWKKLSETVVARNRWWTYMRDEYALPAGTRGEYHYVHTNGSSMVIPVTREGTVLMVNQHRYLMGRESLEFPCGSVNDGSTHDETARRELAEETGYEADRFISVGEFNPYNGVTDELCRVYIARSLRPGSATPDETEEFELTALSAEEIDAKIRDGVIWDGMSIAAWHLVKALVEKP